jgi:hypothetical protein
MTWTVDQPCEVEVTRGKWVAGIVIMGGLTPRVRTMGGKLVRPSPGSIREPKASSSLRHAVPPPSSEVAEVEALEPIPESVVRQVARVTELRRVPKPATPRDRGHLAFVRSLPCAWCGRTVGVEASHHGARGTSIKASDYAAIPLCGGPDGCHTHHTNHHGLPKSAMSPDQTETWFAHQALKVCELRLSGRDAAEESET